MSLTTKSLKAEAMSTLGWDSFMWKEFLDITREEGDKVADTYDDAYWQDIEKDWNIKSWREVPYVIKRKVRNVVKDKLKSTGIPVPPGEDPDKIIERRMYEHIRQRKKGSHNPNSEWLRQRERKGQENPVSVAAPGSSRRSMIFDPVHDAASSNRSSA